MPITDLNCAPYDVLWVFITGESEVMLHPLCLFVCVFACLWVRHDVCPDDLITKGWYHTNNVLQEYRRGCVMKQVMCHILMASLIISWGQKGLKLAITWSVFVVQRGYKYCHNMWLVGHLSNTLGFLFRFETSSEVENENRFREFSKSLFCTR